MISSSLCEILSSRYFVLHFNGQFLPPRCDRGEGAVLRCHNWQPTRLLTMIGARSPSCTESLWMDRHDLWEKDWCRSMRGDNYSSEQPDPFIDREQIWIADLWRGGLGEPVCRRLETPASKDFISPRHRNPSWFATLADLSYSTPASLIPRKPRKQETTSLPHQASSS